ncbi:MAG TPA: MMPL family transporter [Burkholderiales bacterium]|nr:MMPL family transporter [Burkholderiales bacterium]
MNSVLLARAWALAAAALVGLAGFLVLRGAPLQTNLLALLPPTERSAAAERAVAAMHDAAANRAVLLVGHRDPAAARAGARALAAELQASGAFARVQLELPQADPRALLRASLPYRFGLLAEADRRALEAGGFEPRAALERRLNDPLRFGALGGLAADPFGFYDRYVAALPYRSLRLEPSDGLLVARPEAGPMRGGLYVLVSAELPGSAYDDRVQGPVLAALARAADKLQARAPGAELLRAGAVFFAAEARGAAQREVDIIGAGSIAGIVVLLLAVFRSLRPMLLGLLTVAVGLAAAVSATILTHGELHLLTLVFGASLIGEAIDYSIQYFGAYAGGTSAAAGGGRAWDAQRGIALVRPGLTLALLTSLLGYSALLLLPFPAVKQIALFALVGLAAAYLSVLFLLPPLLRKPYAHDLSRVTVPTARFIASCQARVGTLPGLAGAALLLLACAPGWIALQPDDDVRLLSNRPADLLREEAAVRRLTGFEIAGQFFLVEGASAEEVLRREERLTAALGALAAKGALAHWQAVSAFVPSAERQQANRALLREAVLRDPARLQRAFDAIGIRKGVAGELEQAYRESEGRLLTPEAWLATPASAPFRHLWLGRSGGGYASVVLPSGARDLSALAAAAAAAEGVTFLDKTASVSRLFGEYRRGFSYGLALAALVVLAVLSRRYGWRGGAAVLLPTLLGIAAALALSGYAGQPFTLFSVMALMLVLGVGVNYAIFLVEGRGREGPAFVAVLLSAATTVLSFGLLAFSGTPALAQFGRTLVAGIGVAVLLAPLALSLGARGPHGVGRG